MTDARTHSLPKLGPIDHVGVAVERLEESISFYNAVLGWSVVHRETNLEQGVEEAMLLPADGQINTQIQLLMSIRTDCAISRFVERHGHGLHHIAYKVDNAVKSTEHLRTLGLRLLYATPTTGTRGSRINFVHPKDAGGVLIELVEAPKSPLR